MQQGQQDVVLHLLLSLGDQLHSLHVGRWIIRDSTRVLNQNETVVAGVIGLNHEVGETTLPENGSCFIRCLDRETVRIVKLGNRGDLMNVAHLMKRMRGQLQSHC